MRAEAGLRAEAQAGTRDVDRGDILPSTETSVSEKTEKATPFSSDTAPSPRNARVFLGVPRRRVWTHRTREPRGEELRLGGKLGELGDVTTQRPAGEVVLEHLWRVRGSRARRAEEGGVRREREDVLFRGRGKPRRSRGGRAGRACMQCGSLSTWRMISCPASSRPRSRPPIPEKSETVFIAARLARDGVTREDETFSRRRVVERVRRPASTVIKPNIVATRRVA